MTIKGKRFTLKQLLCLTIYYGIAQYLPVSYAVGGGIWKSIRYRLVKGIFKHCGCNVNVERKAHFGVGIDVQIGDNSGLGVNCQIPNGTIIGNDVMIGENLFIVRHNHIHDHIDIPMNRQGLEPVKNVTIDDDVWIGRNVTILPGIHIHQGTIIGTCCVLTKNFEPYSVVGGVPGRLLKSRITQ